MRLDPTCLNRRGLNRGSPLIVAAWRGSLQFASSLLKAGADVDIRGDYGENALHIAVLADQLDLVDLLITNPRVSINSPRAKTGTTGGGETALIIAAQKGLAKIVDRLLKAGAEANTLANSGLSALHWAALRNNLQVIDLLIAAPKINLNVRVRRSRSSKFVVGGSSPLILAARKGNAEAATALISAGADLTIMDDTGNTALHVAVEAGHVAVVEVLVNNGMDVDLLQANLKD
jgi:hypothetical protein